MHHSIKYLFSKISNNEIKAEDLRKIIEWYPSLAQEKDEVGCTLLHYAAREKKLELVEILIDKSDINATNNYGSTSLHEAVRNAGANLKASQKIVQLLIDNDASLDIADLHGFTPLHYACSGGYSALATLLVKEGANYNSWSLSGLQLKTPIQLINPDYTPYGDFEEFYQEIDRQKTLGGEVYSRKIYETGDHFGS